MTLVHNSRGSLEAGPHLLTKLLGHGAGLAILLMQLLKLVERAYNVFLVSQVLGSLTQLGLYLEVLLEVILACLAVKLQQVIELLHIKLVVAPQLACALCRHSLYLFPLLLQLLKLVIRLVCLLRRGGHSLYFLNDVKLLLQVFLLLLLLLLEHLGSLFAHNAHLGLEDLFVLVGHDLISFRIAATVDISL